MAEVFLIVGRKVSTTVVLLLALGCTTGTVVARDGQAVFDETCLLCHGLITEPTAWHLPSNDVQPNVHLAVITPKGPTLNGIVGRPVAVIPNYAYSKAMRALGKTGAVWNRELLDKFLTDSRKMVKGYMVLKMNASDRKLVLDYLESVATYKAKTAWLNTLRVTMAKD